MKTQKNIMIAFILNLFFAIFEFVGGIFTNSVAIISDAIHDLGDAISIGISFFLEKISAKKPDKNYTYGYQRFSILGAFITTVILASGSILVIYNSVIRLFNPKPINYNGMIIFAVIGVVVNFIAAYKTKEGDSINQKSVNLHMLEDVLGWIVVLIGSILMRFTDIKIIDPLMSLGVAIFILYNTFKHFKEILDIFLIKMPKDIDVKEIENVLLKNKDIIDVHHIHIWSMDGINNYATMHVKTSIKNNHDLKENIKEELKHFNIMHTTIEIEDEDEKCLQKQCHPSKNIVKHHHH